MGTQTKGFYCLRCQHRFKSEHNPKNVVERSCPACGSNSVRLETKASARRFDPSVTQQKEVNP